MDKYQNKNILVITSCSAKKKNTQKPIKAKNLYQGDFFSKVRKFALINKFDFKIISAKYGLLSPEEKIKSYNVKIEGENDITNLRKKVNPKLEEEIKNYDKILLIMGKDYRRIIRPISNEKFIKFFDKRGLGGYKALMKYLSNCQKELLYEIMFKHNQSVITLDILKQYNNKFMNFSME